MNSLHARLLLAASLVLAIFLGITAIALERAYRSSALATLEKTLQSRTYTLLAAAEADARGRMALPTALPEPRLSRPQSGLVAWVLDGDGGLFWKSGSLLNQPPLRLDPLSAGKRRFVQEGKWFLLAFGVEWEDDQGRGWPYTLVVAEERTGFDAATARFRQTLWRWLGALAIGLLLIQLAVLRWGLAPLRRLPMELERIRGGARERLESSAPRELRPLTDALNRLLAHERTALNRYRNSLDDLAHSLKTPLAHLQSLAQSPQTTDEELRHAVREETERMDRIVRAELTRASASGRPVLAAPLPVEPVLTRLGRALEKIHHERGISLSLRMEEGVAFAGDEGDLMELAGNLLDNAFKYARKGVRVTVRCTGNRLVLMVEDDGPGIPHEARQHVFQRGVRLDQRKTGEGIGLAAVADLVAFYEGELTLESSELGGAGIEVRLPGCGRE